MIGSATLNTDRTRVSFELRGLKFDLDAPEIQDLIANLASMRMRMLPAVEEKMPAKVQGAARFKFQRAQDGSVAFGMRHLGYGWIGFVLSRTKALDMATRLIPGDPTKSH